MLYTLWFLLWYIYNYVLLPRKWTTEGHPAISGIIFSIFTLLSLLVGFGNGVIDILPQLMLAYVIILIIFFVNKRTAGRLWNSLFQILWLYSFAGLGITDSITLAMIFIIGHFPIFILKFLSFKIRFAILLLSIGGGFSFALAIAMIPFPFSIYLAILIHFAAYELMIRPIDKKYHLNILN